MRNYSHVKRYGNGPKWGKPVIVPEYREDARPSALAIVIWSGLGLFLAWLLYVLVICSH